MYIRGSGNFGDQTAGWNFRAIMINMFGVEEFYEDDHVQGEIISKFCPNCKVILV